ncbi:MAG TPA: molybdate ABC transporter substrate-binding protein [Acidimicrobiales bacterium]|jgi:molybdate transport system substrate-binding protein
MSVPRPFRYRRVLPAVLLALLVPLACSSDSSTTATASSAPASSSGSKASGPVTVFAAASLTESLNDAQTQLKTQQPDLSVTYNFAGSGALVTQIQQGAPADVIATADTDSMKKLTDANMVEAPVTFAKNKLEILVQPGNPKHITGLSDLGRSDIIFVTEDDTVPAGKYSAQALSAAGVTVNPVSKEPDVKSAVAKVTSGEADATIVYVTDVIAAGSKGEGVVIPDDQNVMATYPIAIVKTTNNHAGAQAFVDNIVHGSGQDALHARGFQPA